MKLFVGKNCAPCKMLKQWLVENSIDVIQLVVEDHLEEAVLLGVRSVPSLVLDDNSVHRDMDEMKKLLKESK